MFSTQVDNCIRICPYFCHHILFVAELEEPKIGISGKGLRAFHMTRSDKIIVQPINFDMDRKRAFTTGAQPEATKYLCDQ